MIVRKEVTSMIIIWPFKKVLIRIISMILTSSKCKKFIKIILSTILNQGNTQQVKWNLTIKIQNLSIKQKLAFKIQCFNLNLINKILTNQNSTLSKEYT